jgi:hypothetical protein
LRLLRLDASVRLLLLQRAKAARVGAPATAGRAGARAARVTALTVAPRALMVAPRALMVAPRALMVARRVPAHRLPEDHLGTAVRLALAAAPLP